MTDEESEKRGSRRNRVLKEAFASFNEKFSAVPCVVRDISETGAKLRFMDMAVVPDRFTLVIPLDGIQVECERQWATSRDCGVRFTSAPEQSRLRRSQVVKAYRPGEAVIVTAPSKTQAADEEADASAFPDYNRARPQRAFGRRR
ncbi:PilZ domain-containing protein [Oricola sp.]|uniref:PilZ domain-containing protein n=1 Tax=Oricola sp. TaxID=1979950 RepID=UPI003BA9CFE0